MKFLNTLMAALLAALPAAGAMPMRSTAVAEIAPYVFPANKPAAVSMEFMPDGQSYVERSDDGRRLIVRAIADGAEQGVLFDIANTRETTLPDFEGFSISPDASRVLLWRMAQPVFRRSFDAEYYVYEVRSRLLRPLSKEFGRQRDPMFSPDSRMVAFVAQGNIYCAKLDYNSEVAVTEGGSTGGTLFGATDWTYEEEFGITAAMAWAPDNLNL